MPVTSRKKKSRQVRKGSRFVTKVKKMKEYFSVLSSFVYFALTVYETIYCKKHHNYGVVEKSQESGIAIASSSGTHLNGALN